MTCAVCPECGSIDVDVDAGPNPNHVEPARGQLRCAACRARVPWPNRVETCAECLRACELHGLTFCATCHKHDLQCDCGSCTDASTRTFEFSTESGRVFERRSFCEFHSVSARYGWLRRGGIEIPLERAGLFTRGAIPAD